MPAPAQTVVVCFWWYVANIGVLLGNKYLLSNTGFQQPVSRIGGGEPTPPSASSATSLRCPPHAQVFLTLCHMVACLLLGAAFSASGWTPLKPLKSRQQLVKVAVLAAIFCATIVLGNASLKCVLLGATHARLHACGAHSRPATQLISALRTQAGMQPLGSARSSARATCGRRYLHVSFTQAIGATTPFFTAVLAYFFMVRSGTARAHA